MQNLTCVTIRMFFTTTNLCFCHLRRALLCETHPVKAIRDPHGPVSAEIWKRGRCCALHSQHHGRHLVGSLYSGYSG